jgi:hypothetical protein
MANNVSNASVFLVLSFLLEELARQEGPIRGRPLLWRFKNLWGQSSLWLFKTFGINQVCGYSKPLGSIKFVAVPNPLGSIKFKKRDRLLKSIG